MSAELAAPSDRCQMWHLRDDTGHVLPKPYQSEGEAREARNWMGVDYRVVQGGCTGDHIN